MKRILALALCLALLCPRRPGVRGGEGVGAERAGRS